MSEALRYFVINHNGEDVHFLPMRDPDGDYLYSFGIKAIHSYLIGFLTFEGLCRHAYVTRVTMDKALHDVLMDRGYTLVKYTDEASSNRPPVYLIESPEATRQAGKDAGNFLGYKPEVCKVRFPAPFKPKPIATDRYLALPSEDGYRYFQPIMRSVENCHAYLEHVCHSMRDKELTMLGAALLSLEQFPENMPLFKEVTFSTEGDEHPPTEFKEVLYRQGSNPYSADTVTYHVYEHPITTARNLTAYMMRFTGADDYPDVQWPDEVAKLDALINNPTIYSRLFRDEHPAVRGT